MLGPLCLEIESLHKMQTNVFVNKTSRIKYPLIFVFCYKVLSVEKSLRFCLFLKGCSLK